jgi:DNA polymerase-3 subunit alpha
MVKPDAILAVLGAVDKRGGGDEANLIVNELVPLEELASRYTRAIVLRVREDVHGMMGLERLYEILRGYPGPCSLQLVISLADGTQVKCPCQRLRIEITPEMRSRVEELLGAENVRLVASAKGNGSGGRSHGRSNGR